MQTIQFIKQHLMNYNAKLTRDKIQLQEFLQHFKPIQPIAYLSHKRF
jgi:hypothetical protein